MAMTREGRAVLDRLRVEQGLDPSLPWGGRSPRCLTRAYERFTFKARDDDVNGFFDEEVINEQCRRHLHGF